MLPYKIMCRDEFICKECGQDLALVNEHGVKIPTSKYRNQMDSNGMYRIDAEVHHILPVAEGGEDNASNLVTLCSSCHKKRHSSKKLSNVINLSDYRKIIASQD